MKAEIITIKARDGAKCRACPGETLIKKGERALKVSATSAQSPYIGAISFYCIPHARKIQIMFTKLDI